MSKAKSVATDATEKIPGIYEQQPETLPAVSTNQAIAAAESFGNVSFEFENEDHIVEVTAAYLSMKEGESKDFIFTGMSTTEFADDNAELQQKDIITLLDKWQKLAQKQKRKPQKQKRKPQMKL